MKHRYRHNPEIKPPANAFLSSRGRWLRVFFTNIVFTVLYPWSDVSKFVRCNTRIYTKIEGMLRQNNPEYPGIALQEAPTNAVAHTEYTLRGMQIIIAIFSYRLEIQNPGMTLDDLKSGVSKIRNPVIARVNWELDYMEKSGTGYKRIIEDCDAGGYPHPEWQELIAVMRVKFQPTPFAYEKIPHDVPVNEPQICFLEQLYKGIPVKRYISENFRVSRKTARRDVKYLTNNQFVDFSWSF